MENTLLVATSLQGALRRQMEVIANNIANINTTGFKGERMMFVEHLVNGSGGGHRRSEPIAFVRDIATVRDSSQGREETTGNPLDLAIEGDGYFVVGSPTGDLYTRNGQLSVDGAGQLINEQGMPVLAQSGAPIALSPGDTRITVTPDGTVSTENGELGRLRIVRFDNPHSLRAVSGSLMASDEAPQEVEKPVVAQGMLEGSNVEPILEIERMIEVHRAYDSASRLIDREDERIRKMVQVYAG